MNFKELLPFLGCALALYLFDQWQLQKTVDAHIPLIEQSLMLEDSISLNRKLKSLTLSAEMQTAFVATSSAACPNDRAIKNANGTVIGYLCFRRYPFADTWPLLLAFCSLFAAILIRNRKIKARAIRSFQEKQKKENESLLLEVRQAAHDMASPLNTISRHLTTDPAITSSIERLNGILEGLWGKTQKPSPQIVSQMLQRLLQEKKAEYAHHTNIVFELNANTNGLIANVDENEFLRVCSNLVNNSVEAMADRSGRIHLNCASEGENIVVSIEDEGCGIARDLQPQLFLEPISRGKRNGKGLGLFHARRAVENWGGRINIRSVPRLGTAVEIRLPIASSHTDSVIQ